MVITIYDLLNAYYVPGNVLNSLICSSLAINNPIRLVYGLVHTLRDQDQDLHNLSTLHNWQCQRWTSNYVCLIQELKKVPENGQI